MALLTAEDEADVEGMALVSKPALGRPWQGWARRGSLNLGLHLSAPGDLHPHL